MQSIELVETFVYGTSKDLVNEKEEIKCNNIIKPYKKCMINFDDVTKKSIKKYYTNWPHVSHHLYILLIIGGSG